MRNPNIEFLLREVGDETGVFFMLEARHPTANINANQDVEKSDINYVVGIDVTAQKSEWGAFEVRVLAKSIVNFSDWWS